MRDPKEPPVPPAPPREPFLLRRTPPAGTLHGVHRPPLLPPLPPLPEAAAAPAAAPSDLERHLAGLRLELASFRAWWPGQLAQLAPARRSAPDLGARRRRLERHALALGGLALVLLLALVSAAAALSSPDYARFVARIARLPHPAAPAPTR